MSEAKTAAGQLRAEAIAALTVSFGLPDAYASATAEKLLDHLINLAVLEIAAGKLEAGTADTKKVCQALVELVGPGNDLKLQAIRRVIEALQATPEDKRAMLNADE